MPFIAMERSLRSAGCHLPLLVIPYNNDLFELPKGSSWWETEDIFQWLKSHGARPVMRKYQCLTVSDFQFIDSDVIFLKNPEKELIPFNGFVTCCTHWHNPEQTYTKESKKYLKSSSTIWQSKIFNTGQFACGKALYTFDTLKERAESREFIETCLGDPFHEQPGINLLVANSGVTINNLTLPPINMESTWAGDYEKEYKCHWKNETIKPYLIHWAGGVATHTNYPINALFEEYLTKKEIGEWNEIKLRMEKERTKLSSTISSRALLFKKSLSAFKNTWMGKT